MSKNLKITVGFCAAALLLSGCNSNLSKLEAKNLNNGSYNAKLAKEYEEASKAAAADCNWDASSYLAKRGLNAYSLNGAVFMPQNPASFNINSDEFRMQYGNISSAFNEENMLKFQDQLASAEVNFDVWLYKSHQQWTDIDTAKEKYLAAMQGLYKMSMASHYFKVFFDLGMYKIGAPQMATIEEAARVLRGTNHSKKIMVFGYTDTTGSVKFNNMLSLKRAESVAEYLMKYGIERSRIKIRGLGEINPADHNLNDRKERRVDIFLHENGKWGHHHKKHHKNNAKMTKKGHKVRAKNMSTMHAASSSVPAPASEQSDAPKVMKSGK